MLNLDRYYFLVLFLALCFHAFAGENTAIETPSTATLQLSAGQQRMKRLIHLSAYRHQLNLYAGPFLEMDLDHDNTLTKAEAMKQGRDEAVKRSVESKGLQSQHIYFISQLDGDGDGIATLEEVRQKAGQKADAAVDDYLLQVPFDTNGDGLITGGELEAMGEKQVKDAFKNADKDNDGSLTIEEFFGKPTIEESAAHFKDKKIREMQITAMRKKWEQLDTDGDGYATLDDLLRYHKKSGARVFSKYSQRPELNPGYTLFKERVRFVETGKRSVEILKKYGTKK